MRVSAVCLFAHVSHMVVFSFSAFAEGNPCSESRYVKPVSSCPRSYFIRVSDAAACRSEPAAPAARGAARLLAAEHRAAGDGPGHLGSGASGRSCSATSGSLCALLPARPGESSARLPWACRDSRPVSELPGGFR